MLKQFIADESGLEMVEWAIVGVVFAVASAGAYGILATKVGAAIVKVTGKL